MIGGAIGGHMNSRKKTIISISFCVLILILVILGKIHEKWEESQTTYIREYYQEKVESKLDDISLKMKSSDQKIEYMEYTITMEKVYFDVSTGDGCILVSIKNNAGETLKDNFSYEKGFQTSLLYFDKSNTEEWNAKLLILSDVTKYEVRDNVLYITAYIDVDEGSKYTYEEKIVQLIKLNENDDVEENLGFTLPNTSEARTIKIENNKNILISDYSILVQDDIEELVLYFRDGSKMELYKDKKCVYENVLFRPFDGEYSKMSFCETIDKNKVNYVMLNGKKYN